LRTVHLYCKKQTELLNNRYTSSIIR